MLQDIIHEAVSDAEAVRLLLSATEKLRQLLSGDGKDERHAKSHPIVAGILANLPPINSWRMHEHCATLTRLYAIYERFVAKAVRVWLSELPGMANGYSDLGETFNSNHRRGVARVLLDLDKERFSNLTIAQVVVGLLDAVSNKASYGLLAEAFLFDNRNLKRDRLDQLLAQVKLEGGWDWISSHRFVTDFIREVFGGQNTPEGELKNFVHDRNDAAHGSVDQVLGIGPLTEYAAFVIAVCRAIGELILWNIVKGKQKMNIIQRLGCVTEHYRSNVVVAKLEACNVSPGTEVIVFGRTYCYPVFLESIQLYDVPVVRLEVTGQKEVGLKLSLNAPKNAELYRL